MDWTTRAALTAGSESESESSESSSTRRGALAACSRRNAPPRAGRRRGCATSFAGCCEGVGEPSGVSSRDAVCMARAHPGSELSFASWSGGMAHWRRNAAASHPPRADAMVVDARALGSAEDEGRSSSFNG